MQVDLPDPTVNSAPELELSHVDVFYGKAQVLFDLSIRVERGDVVAVIGANGAGKSTTLNLILGRLKPSTGEVRMAGESIHTLSLEQVVAGGIACVPQRHAFLARCPCWRTWRLAHMCAVTTRRR